MDKDKDDEPKPVADYWINPAFKKRQPGPRGIIIVRESNLVALQC